MTAETRFPIPHLQGYGIAQFWSVWDLQYRLWAPLHICVDTLRGYELRAQLPNLSGAEWVLLVEEIRQRLDALKGYCRELGLPQTEALIGSISWDIRRDANRHRVGAHIYSVRRLVENEGKERWTYLIPNDRLTTVTACSASAERMKGAFPKGAEELSHAAFCYLYGDRVRGRGVEARGARDLRQGWPERQAATAGNLTMGSSLMWAMVPRVI